MTNCVFIFTHCNICRHSLNCNEQYREGIGHDSSTSRESNQSTISSSVILILIIRRDIAPNY